MVMGRRYKWRCDRKVVKGDGEALHSNKEALKGDRKALKDK